MPDGTSPKSAQCILSIHSVKSPRKLSGKLGSISRLTFSLIAFKADLFFFAASLPLFVVYYLHFI